MNCSITTWVPLVLAGVFATAASATTFTLEDLNSKAVFETEASATGEDRSGLISWSTNTSPGGPVIVEQSVWLRLEGETRERPIASYTQTGAKTSDGNFNPGDDAFAVEYTLDDAFRFTGSYSLRGTLCCGSDMGEQFSLLNLGNGPLRGDLFLYTEFDVGSSQYAELANANTFRHSGSRWVTETVLTPGPFRWEIGEAAMLRGELTDDLATTLANAISPLAGANLAWAGQWAFELNPDQTFQLSVDKRVAPIPLPAPAFLLLGGLAALGVVKRRRAT